MSDQLSANGQFLFGQQDGRAFLTDVVTGERIDAPIGVDWITGTQIKSMSADGNLVLVAGLFPVSSGEIRSVDFVWDRAAHTFTAVGLSQSYYSIAGSLMSDDGSQFVVCDQSNGNYGHYDEIYVLDRSTGKITNPVTAPTFGDVSAKLTLVGMSGDAARFLYIASFGDLPGAPQPTLTWLDRTTGQSVAIAATAEQMTGAKLSHNGLFAFLPGVDGADGTIVSTATGAVLGMVHDVTVAAFVSDDGQYVYAQTSADWTADGSDAGGGNDLYKVGLWSGEGEPPAATLLTRHLGDGGDVTLNGISADGRTLHVTSAADLYKGEIAATGAQDYTVDTTRAAEPIDTASERGEAIEGNDGGNTIAGLGGDDRLYGRDGDDTLDGGEGRDRLEGGEGDDTLLGGAGDDVLIGGAGDDIVYGGAGSDTFHDGAGSDTYHGGSDADGMDRDVVTFDGSADDRIVTERIETVDGVATHVIELTAANGDVDTLSGIEVVRFAELRGNVAIADNPLIALAEAISETYAGQPIGRGWSALTGFELGIGAGGEIADSSGQSIGRWTFSNGMFRAYAPEGDVPVAVASVSFGVVDGKTTLMVALGDNAVAPTSTFAQLHALLEPLHGAIQSYVADSGHSAQTLDQVWIGGHSLAGSVLQTWTGEANGIAGAIPYTFGAPGAPEHLVEGPVIAVSNASDVAPIVSAIDRYLALHGASVEMIPGMPAGMVAALDAYAQALGNMGPLSDWAYNIRISGSEGVNGDPVAAHSMDAYLQAVRTLTAFAPDHAMFGNHGYFDWGEDLAVNFMFGGDGAEVLGGYPFELLGTLTDDAWWLRAATEIWGKDGADTLVGSECNDTLYGGLGDDIMTGGPTVAGIANNDTFIFDGLSRDTVTDYEWNYDAIDLRPALKALGLGEDAFDTGQLRLVASDAGATLVYVGDGSQGPSTIGVFNGVTVEELRETHYVGTHITKPALLVAPSGSSISYVEDSPAVRLMAGATLGDPVITRYENAQIVLSVSDPEAQIGFHDRARNGLTLNHASDGNLYVMSGKTIVGSVQGLGTSEIQVIFSAKATPGMVERVLSAFDALVPGDDPGAGTFEVSLSLSIYGRTQSVMQQLEIVPVDDAARGDGATIGEDQAATGNLLANDDLVEGEPPLIAAVDGKPGNVGRTITLPSGAKLTVQADGSYRYDPDHAFDALVDGQTATDRFTYTLANGGGTATVTLTIDGSGLPVQYGTTRADRLVGTNGNDLFDLSQGGNDIVDGRGGIDTYYFGAALTARDEVKASTLWGDTLLLQGDYDLRLADTTINGIDRIVLMSGEDTSWGDVGGRHYDYALRTAVGSVPAGGILAIDGAGLGAGETLAFTGAAETIGRLFVTGGAANDAIRTGAGDDLLDGGAGADMMRGGGGDDTYIVDHIDDQVIEKADEGIDTVQTALSTYELGRSLENLTYSGATAFEGVGNELANVLTGGSGADRLSGLAGNDVLNGGGGDDVLRGGRGADVMAGGEGTDRFIIARGDSLVGGYDTILDFDFATDKLTVAGDGFIRSANVSTDLGSDTLANDLTSALAGVLDAGGVSVVVAQGGDLSGRLFLVIDQDGQAGFAANADLVIDVTGATNLPAAGVDFLV